MTPSLRVALALSVGLFALRLGLAETVGFGDAEALYASYALHPQPGYVDHPGLVGSLARWLGNGDAPSPVAVHRFTAVIATLLPWLGYGAARAAGATAAGALFTLLALALWPELALGLFALTPDVPLAAAWLTATGALALALRSPIGSLTALAGFILFGLAAGAATLSKASGSLLLPTFVLALGLGPARTHVRTFAPWVALALALTLSAPLAAWEVAEGFPLLVHRFVTTQRDAGFTLRNLGALVGGQLLYVTPPLLLGAYRVLRHHWSRRKSDPSSAVFSYMTVVSGAPLTVLCLWSRVAEPHWLAPAYLPLALGAAFMPPPSRLVRRGALAVGLAAPLLAYVLVATPVYPRLAGPRYVPRYDLVNDLHAWGPGRDLLEQAVSELVTEGRKPVVVAEHWTIAAQVHAALGRGVPVGDRRGPSDFSRWYPLPSLQRSPTLLHVTDDRFPTDVTVAFPGRTAAGVHKKAIYRGGRVVRTLRVTRLERSAGAGRHPAGAASATLAGWADKPATRSSSESASGPGLGVVSSRSP